MFSQEVILVVSIAILYSYFFKKLADVVVGQHEIDTMCDKYYDYKLYPSYGFFTNRPNRQPTAEESQKDEQKRKEEEACRKVQKESREQADTKKFYVLLAAGVLGVIVASQLKIPAASVGIGIGGVLSVLYATYVYWSHFNEVMKLGAIGFSLVSLLYTSVKLYQDQSLFKLFTNLK